MVERLGIHHVKGVLLFGPPGTGKTLIARQIGKMLNGREPKVQSASLLLTQSALPFPVVVLCGYLFRNVILHSWSATRAPRGGRL